MRRRVGASKLIMRRVWYQEGEQEEINYPDKLI